MKEYAEAIGNALLVAYFLVIFTGIYALEEWLWRRRTRQTIRKLLRLL